MRGKARIQIFQMAISGDHPRLCGEKAAGHRTRQANPGSPPPMRGKGYSHSCPSPCRRITPAYAGKSERKCRIMSTWLGSPPPMRGKVSQTPRVNFIFGITPAYAGKRSVRDGVVVFVWDHPRLCGEKDNYILEAAFLSGSPPPMRGKVCI